MTNLTGRPVTPKGQPKKKSNDASPQQRVRWEKVRALGCIVDGCGDRDSTAVHHAKTGKGGRKDHDKVLPLCFGHHQGSAGIHTLSRKVWQDIYGSEDYYLVKVKRLLGECI